MSKADIRRIVDDHLRRDDTTFSRMIERLHEVVVAHIRPIEAERDSWRLCHDEIAQAIGLHPEASHMVVLDRVKRAAQLKAAARELLGCLPRCQHSGCKALAFWGYVSHEPDRCDEHRDDGHPRKRDAWWADAARRLGALLEGE